MKKLNHCNRLTFQHVCLAVIIAVVLILNLYVYSSSTDRKNAQTVTTNNLKKFYVYDWPNNVVDLWPTEYTHHRLSIEKHFKENYGVGQEVDREKGMYHTHQYSLFSLLHYRLLESPHRTLDPVKAEVFFIPYDLGMDGSTRKSDGALIQTNCPHVGTVIKLLKESPYFQRKQGADHFLLHSINQMMLYYANPPCTRLYEECYNCTKLSIDTYSAGVYTHLDTHSFMTHNWVSIPFPSNYHYSAHVQYPPWLDILQDHNSQQTSSFTQKKYAISFVGTIQVTAKLQRELRLELIRTCNNVMFAKNCLHVPLHSHESHESIYQRNAIDDHSKISSNTSTSTTQFNPYAQSKLCLSPGTLLLYLHICFA